MTPGTVIFHRNFQFPDGDVANKLFVILSPGKNKRILAAKTTSIQKRRPARDGCHPGSLETVYAFHAHRGGFREPTWIVFSPPYILDRDELLARSLTKQVEVIFVLKGNDLRALINCLKRSADVSPHHLALLD